MYCADERAKLVSMLELDFEVKNMRLKDPAQIFKTQSLRLASDFLPRLNCHEIAVEWEIQLFFSLKNLADI